MSVTPSGTSTAKNNFDNLGWTNSAMYGSLSVLSYVFHWITVMVVLMYMKFKEGHSKLLGRDSESKAGVHMRVR